MNEEVPASKRQLHLQASLRAYSDVVAREGAEYQATTNPFFDERRRKHYEHQYQVFAERLKRGVLAKRREDV